MNYSRIIPITLILLLSLVSFYTSFDGLKLFALVDSNKNSTIGTLIIGVLVLSIQLFLVYSLHRLAKTKRFSVKLRWLVPYLLMMLVSVFFSYGFYYKLIRADGYAKDEFTVQLSAAKTNAQQYLNAFELIQNGGDKLKEYSLKRSNEEKQFGGTCGDGSPPGKGPRQKFRLEEAEKFKYLAENIRPLTEKVKSEINELQQAIDSYTPEIKDLAAFQQGLNNIVQRINANNTSFVLSYTKEAIQSRIGKNRETIIAGKLGCPDSTITNSGKVMLKNIAALSPLDEIKLFDPKNQKEVLKRAMEVFKNTPTVLLHSLVSDVQASKAVEQDKDKIILKTADYVPLILGAVIDFMLLIIGVTNGVKSREDNWLSAKFEGEYFSVTDADKIKKSLGLTNVVEVIQPHVLKTIGGYFFIIPSTSVKDHPLSGKLLEMFEVLATERIKPAFLHNIPFQWLPSSARKHMENLYSHLDDKPSFNFYRMNKAQWEEFKQVFNVSNVRSQILHSL